MVAPIVVSLIFFLALFVRPQYSFVAWACGIILLSSLLGGLSAVMPTLFYVLPLFAALGCFIVAAQKWGRHALAKRESARANALRDEALRDAKLQSD